MQETFIHEEHARNEAILTRQDTLRILVAIPSFGTSHDAFLRQLAEEYRSMPAKVDIAVFSNIEKAVPDGVELIVGMPSSDPWSLLWAHKAIFAERVDSYDIFIYCEDDILVKWHNIEAFLRVTPELQENEIAGFLLYEKCADGSLSYVGAHSHFHWDPGSVVRRGAYTFAYFTNEHSAFYITNQNQLKKVIQTGKYLTPPHTGKYNIACTASAGPYTQGLKKLICISHLDEFLLHHLPNKYAGTRLATDEPLFNRQLEALLQIGKIRQVPASLMNTVTNLPQQLYSKNYYEPARPEVLDEISRRGNSVLSLGCGAGDAERWLAKRGAAVTAVCLDAVVGASARSEGIEIVYGDWHSVENELEGREFDCLYISMLLHLLEHPSDILNRFGRFIRAGGSCVIHSHNLDNFKCRVGKIMGHSVYEGIGNFPETGVRKVNASLLSEWLGSAGFVVEKIAYLEESNRKILRLLLPQALSSEEILALARKGG